MSDSVSSLRAARKSGTVLKTRLSQLRARSQTSCILIFEGPDDVGPYDSWLARLGAAFSYVPLSGSGKEQLLELRRLLQRDEQNLGSGVYFFVDRDFDDLKGSAAGPDLFCTEAYSIENYLVSTQVLSAILIDEFRCPPETDERDNLLKVFDRVVGQFFECMKGPNKRSFLGIRLGIPTTGMDRPINQYVRVEHDSVVSAFDEEDLPNVIALAREPTDDETRVLNDEFAGLDPALRHRGKWVLAFFQKWLTALALEKRREGQKLFSSHMDVTAAIQQLSLRSLASRSATPHGLEAFVAAIVPPKA